MNRISTIRQGLSDEQLLTVCHMGKWDKVCPFLILQTGVNKKGVLTCINFTRERVNIAEKFRRKTGKLGKIGCNYFIDQFILSKESLIGKKVEYIGQPNEEEKYFVDIIFDDNNDNISVMIKTDRDTYPFVFSVKGERACFKETTTGITIYNVLGHDQPGIIIYK